jgi:hypothetical protein
MRRWLTCVAVVWAFSACSHALVPQPKVASAQASVATRTAPGERHELTGFGLSAQFPSEPKATTQAEEKDDFVLLAAEGPNSYALWALSMRSRDRPPDQKWYDGIRERMKATQSAETRLGTLRGVELSGKIDGRASLTRVFAVGDTLLAAQVVGFKAPLDEPAAQRFFDSLQLEQPFRIYASATTKFSVMVPAHAIEVDKTEARPNRRSCTRLFFVGGDDKLGYWVSAEEVVDRNPDVKDDQILDAALDAMEKEGTHVTWQAPVQVEGARGRDFLAGTAHDMVMGRIWITEHFIYMLMVSGNSREAVQRAGAAKFYASFVSY